MTHWLLREDGAFDRAAVMRMAHDLYRANRRKRAARKSRASVSV